ncbi:DUF2242 domain-containing protein [Ottowia thiooxydans]|uniref:DUF2242 domain-containing protein n=1 Tax=Ottowia thiooxydans TaxID=219182 RepID=UPI001FE1AC4A|nr:DUF2242 domain-containing protein [Ottowia thiooxydans]
MGSIIGRFPTLLQIWMPFDFFSRPTAAWLLVPTFLLGGCSGLSRAPAPLLNYKPEAFSAATYSRNFAAEPSQTCEAARRALLGQGYILASATADQVTARKYFQPNSDHHVQLEFRVVCALDAGGHGNTIAFASGLQDQYSIRKVKESASLGVGGFGSLSLPVEGSMDSMVKVASETVTDAELYQRFFDLLADHLDSVVPPETTVAPPAPAPRAQPVPAVPTAPATPPVAPAASPALAVPPATAASAPLMPAVPPVPAVPAASTLPVAPATSELPDAVPVSPAPAASMPAAAAPAAAASAAGTPTS